MIRCALLLSVTAAMLSACTASPPPEVATPVPQVPDSFVYAPQTYDPSQAEQTSLEQLLPQSDLAFASLRDTALAQSPSLLEALARIDAARAGARRAGAERLPNVAASAGVESSRTNPDQFGSNLPPGISFDTEQTAYSAGLSMRWEADLFGRLRAQERAAVARIDAADANALAVRNALTAEIAANVIDWRTLGAREEALRQDLAASERLASLAGTRERAGLSPGFDRVRAEAAANATRVRLAALSSERARIVGRLATLTAQGGASVQMALNAGETLSPVPAAPTSLPSALLTNRPDVQAASALLAAQDAELAATAARRFPQLSLSSALGLLAFNPADLFDEDALIYSLGASIAAPLFDFGRIEAEIDAAAADKRIAFQAYRGAVFTALGDAEAAYGLVAAADAQARAAEAEFASSERAARLADTRYRAGLADFLTVLEARRAADASGERAAAALGQARLARVILWQALGGSGH